MPDDIILLSVRYQTTLLLDNANLAVNPYGEECPHGIASNFSS